MTGSVNSVSYSGLHCQVVTVEADVSRHLPSFILVGLPDTAVQEARERIRSALENSAFSFPRTKVTVNLAPANVRKEGSCYDLAIALSILLAQGAFEMQEKDRGSLFVGELALNGSVRPVSGIFLVAKFARELGARRLYIPAANAREASFIRGVQVFPVTALHELVRHLSGVTALTPVKKERLPKPEARAWSADLAEVQGQEQAKRALEIAAAGGHNVLLNGVPGSGKTMLAKAFPSIMPPLSQEEMLEVSQIYSSAGLLSAERPLVTERPIRTPHHTSSVVSIIAGGSLPRPGEITLAHRGVLFFDEMPEFPRDVIEGLRQPLEDRVVSISRAAGRLTFPSHFTFIGAQNPCPCGSWGDTEKTCLCTSYRRQQYQRKLSGPVMDRIDLHVRVYAVERERLLASEKRETSEEVRARVIAAREKQQMRFTSSLKLNGDMSSGDIKKWCALDTITQALLVSASKQMTLSARSFFKTLKVARTIADLEGREAIMKEDVLEALQYRQASG